ncbi:MAG: FAD-binding and (Fe-S)-binding domain-containing protein [Syntrophothermus sp.]
MNPQAQKELENAFHERVNFDPIERMLYGHDTGILPRPAKLFQGKTVPAAVVQPESREELVKLVQWSHKYQIPLVPRGRATAGYGGAVPGKNGVVVDFSRMNRVLAVDAQQLTVTVEAGIIWKRLDEALKGKGLTLRLYPTSYPSSSVGGWVAQGGGGLGSFKYGWFNENIVSAEVVLPTGEVRTFAGEDLDLVYGAGGITGLISQVTVRIRPRFEELLLAARFENATQLAKFLNQVQGMKLPVWSISFLNPEMVRLKNQLPPRTHHGKSEERRPQIPVGYIAILAWDPGEGLQRHAVEEVVRLAGGNVLAQEIAAHEWAERFSPMKVKRLGPSLVPAEVVVPLASLGTMLANIERAVRLPFVIEGMLVKGGEVVLLGFIPHDERTLKFNMAYLYSLTTIRVAQKVGGRAYSTGSFMAHKGPFVLGKSWDKLREYKRKVDVKNLMNPGKVVKNGPLGTLVRLAETAEPLVRPFASLAMPKLGERSVPNKRIPADVAWYSYACAQCGYCTEACTLHSGRQWESASPRGKWYFLREVLNGRAKFDQKMVNTFLLCTTCEKCDLECQLDLPIEPSWGQMRGDLVQNKGYMTFPPFEIMGASLNNQGNIWAGFREKRDSWVTPDLEKKISKKSEIAYFAGCTASYVEPDIAKAAVTLLDAAGINFTYIGQEENCCGIPMLVAGKWDIWESNMRKNIAAMKSHGVKTVVTSCPACWLVWHTYYPQWAEKLGIEYGLEAKHYSEVITEQIAAGKLPAPAELKAKVTFHDSCHLGRAGKIYDAPRNLLKAIPGVELVEMEHNREQSMCCGSVLTRIGEPKPTSDNLGAMRVQEAVDAGAEAMVAICPCCEFQLRVSANNAGINMPVKDLAALTAKALGYEFPDPTGYVYEMWTVFEKMIDLMEPEQMASLMVELLPQMMKAMPRPLGAMMNMVQALPPSARSAALEAMRPVFPKLFPRLLPGMMPKVMPDMLAAVERRIPMPDDMKKQMPDLMPKVMENLMPKMLPSILPLVIPPMIDYLKGRKTMSIAG